MHNAADLSNAAERKLSMSSGRILVAQGGGPTAVINQSLAGVVLDQGASPWPHRNLPGSARLLLPRLWRRYQLLLLRKHGRRFASVPPPS